MSNYYLCPEPSGIPGISGLFAGVRVDVADDGTYTTTPLAQHYAFEPEQGTAIIWHVNAPANTTVTIDVASADALTADNPATAPEENQSAVTAATPVLEVG
jgi:hypothetical protein